MSAKDELDPNVANKKAESKPKTTDKNERIEEAISLIDSCK